MNSASTLSTPFITITMIGLPVMRARMRWNSRLVAARAGKSSRRSASSAASMLAASASRSAGVARAQASRTRIDSSQMRASVSCAGWIAPMWYMSIRPVAMASPLRPLMKAPPLAPFCSRIRPACSSERSASRSVLRDTPNCSDSARSDGSRVPTLSRPCDSSPRICWAISSKARAERMGWNLALRASAAGGDGSLASMGNPPLEKLKVGPLSQMIRGRVAQAAVGRALATMAVAGS